MPFSLGHKVHKIVLPESNKEITFLVIRALNLYVITDARGFGSNWVKVSHTDKTYDTCPLMGPDTDENMTSLARFFATSVIQKRLQALGLEHVPVLEKTELLFSITLRDTTPDVARHIREEFEKIL